MGDTILIDIVRCRQRLTVTVELRPYLSRIPEETAENCCNDYAVFGGAVFVPMTGPWVSSNKMVLPLPYLIGDLLDFQEDRNECVIVLNSVLSHDCNFGYHEFTRMIVESVNGVKPSKFSEFVAIVQRVRDATERKKKTEGGKEKEMKNKKKGKEKKESVLSAAGTAGWRGEQDACGGEEEGKATVTTPVVVPGGGQRSVRGTEGSGREEEEEGEANMNHTTTVLDIYFKDGCRMILDGEISLAAESQIFAQHQISKWCRVEKNRPEN